MSVKNTVKEIRDELVEAYNNGGLIDYISESDASLSRDEDGDLSQIVFGNGGPFVYLCFEERSGVLCGYDSPWDNEGSYCAISLMIWSDVRDEILDYFMDINL